MDQSKGMSREAATIVSLAAVAVGVGAVIGAAHMTGLGATVIGSGGLILTLMGAVGVSRVTRSYYRLRRREASEKRGRAASFEYFVVTTKISAAWTFSKHPLDRLSNWIPAPYSKSSTASDTYEQRLYIGILAKDRLRELSRALRSRGAFVLGVGLDRPVGVGGPGVLELRIMLDPKAVPLLDQLGDFGSIRVVGETELGTNLEPDRWD